MLRDKRVSANHLSAGSERVCTGATASSILFVTQPAGWAVFARCNARPGHDQRPESTLLRAASPFPVETTSARVSGRAGGGSRCECRQCGQPETGPSPVGSLSLLSRTGMCHGLSLRGRRGASPRPICVRRPSSLVQHKRRPAVAAVALARPNPGSPSHQMNRLGRRRCPARRPVLHMVLHLRQQPALPLPSARLPCWHDRIYPPRTRLLIHCRRCCPPRLLPPPVRGRWLLRLAPCTAPARRRRQAVAARRPPDSEAAASWAPKLWRTGSGQRPAGASSSSSWPCQLLAYATRGRPGCIMQPAALSLLHGSGTRTPSTAVLRSNL